MSQSSFFQNIPTLGGQSGPPQQPQLVQPQLGASEPPNGGRKRMFGYDGKQYEDPSNGAWSLEEARRQLAEAFPGLETATWTISYLPDGAELVEFHKVTGEKGIDEMTPQQLIDLLNVAVKPVDVQPLNLLAELSQLDETHQLDARLLLDYEPQIEAALHYIEQVSKHSEEVVKRCLALTPMPLPSAPPVGF